MRSQRTRLLVIALGIVAVPLVILVLLAAAQTGSMADELRHAEHELLQQTARSLAAELSYRVSQNEGELLRRLDLSSRNALLASLATVERTVPDTGCFALLDTGQYLYPVAPWTNAGVRARMHAVDMRRQGLIARASEQAIARVYLHDPDSPLIVSLHRLQEADANGMIGFVWSDRHVRRWCVAAASELLPAGYVLELVDQYGSLLARYPPDAPDQPQGGSLEDKRSVALAMKADSFPWQVRVRPEQPGKLDGVIERQVWFHRSALLLLFAAAAIGVWLLVATALREAELGRLKTDFAANVSHELRTPLAMIRGAADAFAMRPQLDSARTSRYLDILVRETRRMSELVENVLTFSRVSDKHGNFDFQIADLCDIARTFVEDYEPLLQEKKRTLNLAVPAKPVYVKCDPDAVHLVLSNLVDNALKFSSAGQEVDVAVHAGNGNAVLRVRDQGIGMEPKYHERIFESYFRAEVHLRKETRGAGIGLAIVRDVVRAHQGRIAVESEPGRGTTFTITMPVAADLADKQHTPQGEPG